jgi:thiol-disulfide isomerase/thioredoxin
MNLEINKPYQFAAIAVLIAGTLAYGLINTPTGTNVEGLQFANKSEAVEMKEDNFQRAKPLVEPTGFINADNVSIEENVGNKVILLDMWTYSCINCQRTFPHLKEWNRKYRDDGLLIIGNHAPEFEFEKERSNVKDAVKKHNLNYPVVLDNKYGTWNAYNNRYWPQKYLIGVDGFIRYERIGEGRYERTEQKIRELLKELKRRKGENPILTDEELNLAENQLDSTDVNTDRVETPEIYFGASRNTEYLENGQTDITGTQNLKIPENIREDRLYLSENWNFTEEYASSEDGEIVLDYKAKNVNMVLEGNDTSVKVFHNGEPVTEASGELVTDSTITIGDEQLYSIIRNQEYSRNTLKLEIKEGKLKAYTFTFG